MINNKKMTRLLCKYYDADNKHRVTIGDLVFGTIVYALVAALITIIAYLIGLYICGWGTPNITDIPGFELRAILLNQYTDVAIFIYGALPIIGILVFAKSLKYIFKILDTTVVMCPLNTDDSTTPSPAVNGSECDQVDLPEEYGY